MIFTVIVIMNNEFWDKVYFSDFIDHYLEDQLKIIYAIEINDKLYIGQTKNTRKRFSNHASKKSGCSYLRNALGSYGIENATIRVLETDLSYDDANMMEAFYIELFETLAPNGYNLTMGGDVPLWSPQMLEVFRTPEMRQHRKELSTEMWQDQNHRQKLKIIWESEEWKERRSIATKNSWKNRDYRDKQMETRASKDFRQGQSEGTKKQWEDPEMRRDRTEAIIQSRYYPSYIGNNNLRRGAIMGEFIELYNKHNGVRKHIIAENKMSITDYKRKRKFMECMYFM